MQIIMGGTDVKISRDASMECTGDKSLHLHGRVMRRRASPCIYIIGLRGRLTKAGRRLEKRSKIGAAVESTNA